MTLCREKTLLLIYGSAHTEYSDPGDYYDDWDY
jgi:hypothetical protein